MFYKLCYSTYRAIALVLFVFVLWSCQNIALPKSAPLTASTELPQAPGYLRGILDNGLHYSIRANDRIKDQMIMYLAVNVGSLQEEEDQQGLAHFVEHMAFNGSKHFPGNTLIEFARENGMDFGSHLNAYTSFDRTVYNFTFPTGNDLLLDKSLLVLYDWLNGLSIAPEEVVKERGIVLDEWRGSLGFWERAQKVWLPVLLEGSRFAERLPIGLPDIIENAPPNRLRDFYEKWYNTENAMVVIVGDFDARKMEKKVRELFAPIERRGQKLSRGLDRAWEAVPIRSLDENGQPQLRAVQIHDDEASERSVLVSIKQPRMKAATTVGQLRTEWIRGLLFIIINQRFSDIVTNQSDVVQDMGLYWENLGNASIYSARVGAQKGKLKQAYILLFQAIAKLKKYGLLQHEMDWGLKALHSNIEREYREKDKQYNQFLASAEIEHYFGTAYNRDVTWLYQNFAEIVTEIQLEDLNALLMEIFQSGDISLNSIGKDLEELPNEEELIRAYLAIDTLEVSPPENLKSLPKQLLENIPQAGTIRTEEQLPKTGYVHWTLSNGIEVYFKRTEFEQNQLEYSASRPGGTFSLGDQFGSIAVMSQLLNFIVSDSGFAGLSPEEYERYMKLKKISNYWGFYDNFVSLGGGGDLGDAEELFQQIHLSFTQPQFSQKLVDQNIQSLRTWYDNILSNPVPHFYYLTGKHRYQNDSRLFLPKNISTYKAEQVKEAFRQLVPSGKGFRFIFVGNIEENELKDYVKQYIASIPTDKSFDAKIEEPFNLYEEGGVQEYPLGQDNKAFTVLLWEQYMETPFFSDEESFRFTMIKMLFNKLLNIQITDVLREGLGKTYSPQLFLGFARIPQNRMIMELEYTSKVEEVKELEATVEVLLTNIRQGKIDDDDFQKTKEILTKELGENLQSNRYLRSGFQRMLIQGYEDIDTFFSEAKFQNMLANIDKRELVDFALKYILSQRKVRYTMLPKSVS